MRAHPFALGLVLLVSSSASAQSTEPPPIQERQIIVQGSIGQPGREIAFLNCYNADQIGAIAGVIIAGEDFWLGRDVVLPPQKRTSVNLGTDVPFMPPRAYYSIEITVAADDGLASAAACDLTWHRASDLAEVESRAAVVRRSPKR